MTAPRPAPPIAMLAELTHRCPLACPYCSNPLKMVAREGEIGTEAWADIFAQAAKLGVLQLHLSGGEPASRRDLTDLVRAARDVDLYVNLITSGIGLTEARLRELDAAGVEHVQLSLQGVNAGIADLIGGYKGGFDRKMQVARMIGEIGMPLTLNAVMHRHNLDDLPQTLDMAVELGARRIEIACVQFQGWALKNRAALQPTREQVAQAKALVDQARRDMRGTLVIDFVPPDYYADYPKACMGGWGSTGLNVTPDGTVLPCHAAETIPGLTFQNATEVPLDQIWYDGAAFNAFRGTDWMPEPCQSCSRREVDFGGCRCQAMAIVGRAEATDPVCKLSPDRPKVDALLTENAESAAGGTTEDFIYRRLEPVRAR
ncbi:pyrroloquinoline quinone biosynthesis protein PqqE (plasmid) [Paracoccus sp. TK19116]|uniref:PqqA peptide cyclase n=1 Tax=Paracoccus albicereus TaxID=2922394 RepID=A0ABT1MN16_9RHOB|nr:pyrroloquinoline quinone biosynthesis protein PqqE [Paracoccus albicereus]MCQ0968991.1 pyrroloquinoline quinone biosynthesis protein PqqE [Paracoccus albicereus]